MTSLRMVLSLVLLAASAVLTGCPAVAWTAAQFAPPQKVKPIFEMPKDQKVLVFVDSDRPLSFEPIKGMLTDNLNKQLLDHKIAASVVSRNRLLDVLDEPREHMLSNAEVGQKVGADLVLYIKIEKFSVKDDEASPLYVGRLSVTARLIDVKNLKRIWPTDQNEHVVQPLELNPVDESSPSYGNVVATALAEGMSDRLAKFFYEYTVPNTGEAPAGH